MNQDEMMPNLLEWKLTIAFKDRDNLLTEWEWMFYATPAEAVDHAKKYLHYFRIQEITLKQKRHRKPAYHWALRNKEGLIA